MFDTVLCERKFKFTLSTRHLTNCAVCVLVCSVSMTLVLLTTFLSV